MKFLAQAGGPDPAKVTLFRPNEIGFSVNPFELPPPPAPAPCGGR